MRRRVTLLVSRTLILLTITACLAWGVMFAYVKWAEYSKHNVVAPLRNQALIQRMFIRKEFRELLRVISKGRQNTFPTTWDFDQGIALSKDMFVSQEMFGEVKYRYRPNMGIYNVIVWSGLYGQPFALPATAEITASLAKNKLFTNVYFETDDYGFKKTEFTWNSRSLTIFFLGDSYTEGSWVASKDTFVNLVGLKLQSVITSVTPINLGVDGYSALEADWMLEQYAPILHPQVAVMSLFPNDVHANYIKAVKGEDVPEANYQEMFRYLQRMKSFCENSGIKLVIALIPVRQQLEELRGFSVFQDRVKAWCEVQGLPCLDARDYFESLGADRIYFPWDPHFSPSGHAAYAEFLYQQLLPLVAPANSPDNQPNG